MRNKITSKISQGALTGALLFFLFGCSAGSQHSQTMLLMGTYATITLVPNSQAGRDAVAKVFCLFQERERQLNYYDPESELSKLNTAALNGPTVVSELLFALISRSVDYSRKTDGAFDVTASSYNGENGFLFIKLDPIARTVTITHPQVRIDLGGIAVGYVLDEAVALLRRCGQHNFMIDIGGDIYVSGNNARGTPWRAGIRHPLKQDVMIEYLCLSDKSVTTSGNYLRPHIIDPGSSVPMHGTGLSVTVIAPQAIDADALATAFFVMGMEKTRAFLKQYPNIQAVFVVQGEEELEVIRIEGAGAG